MGCVVRPLDLIGSLGLTSPANRHGIVAELSDLAGFRAHARQRLAL